MGTQRLDFAEFYREVKDECLFTVLVSVGDRDAAQDLVDEAFARERPGRHCLSAALPVSEAHAQRAAWVVARQTDARLRSPFAGGAARPDSSARCAPTASRPASLRRPRIPACQGYPGGGCQRQQRQLLGSVVTGPATGRDVMVIHPAALPPGAGLQINALFRHDPGQHGSLEGFSVGLVQASPQCTGS